MQSVEFVYLCSWSVRYVRHKPFSFWSSPYVFVQFRSQVDTNEHHYSEITNQDNAHCVPVITGARYFQASRSTDKTYCTLKKLKNKIPTRMLRSERNTEYRICIQNHWRHCVYASFVLFESIREGQRTKLMTKRTVLFFFAFLLMLLLCATHMHCVHMDCYIVLLLSMLFFSFFAFGNR